MYQGMISSSDVLCGENYCRIFKGAKVREKGIIDQNYHQILANLAEVSIASSTEIKKRFYVPWRLVVKICALKLNHSELKKFPPLNHTHKLHIHLRSSGFAMLRSKPLKVL